MIYDRILLLGLGAVALVLAMLVIDDGMATCQLTHSFDVCHDSLH